MHTSFLAIGRDWWLPANYAVHGRETDVLFQWFFWITIAVFVGVEVTLCVFVLKYRNRVGDEAGKKARFIHGNTRLEIAWTVIPAVILAVMAFASKRVWDDFRFSPDLEDPNRTKILVVGQQFKWNVIYSGPDGKIGRYLSYPKPTDLTWPVGPGGVATKFAGVTGPALLPLKAAVSAINSYVDSENPLGKDFADPDGVDDDWTPAPGRPIYVPVDRPVEVQLESKDVIHDFFLPNFRLQLYAVPGMKGRFVFTPTITTRQLEAASREVLSVDQLIERTGTISADNPGNSDIVADLDEHSPGAIHDKTGWKYVDVPTKKKPITLLRDGMPVAAGVAQKLKTAGIKQVTVHKSQPFEIVCAQLCGAQHYTMRGEMIVLSQEEFDRRFNTAH